MNVQIEGGVYLCEWRPVGKSFRVWSHDRPEWSAVGRSFAEAEGDLVDIIIEATGDMQPCIEYKPPAPKEAIQARFEGPGIVAVSGANDRLDFAGRADDLFLAGICPVCKRGVGARSTAPLVVSRFPAQSDGAFLRIPPAGMFGNMKAQIYSDEFVQSLSEEERSRFEWLPVEAASKSKRRFFEPVSSPTAPNVMPKGLFSEKDRLQPDGFYCKNCGRKQLVGIPQGGSGIYIFVSEADLPKPAPSCFQVGQCGALEFCMTNVRWQELVGKAGARRLMSRQVGVVKAVWVNPNPKLDHLPKE